MPHMSADTDPVAELVAKVLYEQQYHRVWEDAPKWARRESLSCALTVIETLRATPVPPQTLCEGWTPRPRS